MPAAASHIHGHAEVMMMLHGVVRGHWHCVYIAHIWYYMSSASNSSRPVTVTFITAKHQCSSLNSALRPNAQISKHHQPPPPLPPPPSREHPAFAFSRAFKLASKSNLRRTPDLCENSTGIPAGVGFADPQNNQPHVFNASIVHLRLLFTRRAVVLLAVFFPLCAVLHSSMLRDLAVEDRDYANSFQEHFRRLRCSCSRSRGPRLGWPHR